MASTVLSVTQLNFYMKALLESDERLMHVYLRGEISNFTNHIRSGHFYFSLKDESSVIKAVMFRNSNQRLKFRPADGMKVLVMGRVGVYERDGVYQIYVDDMQPDGAGALALAYEQLKNRLEQEGLFSPDRKKPLPRFPKRIGVITSPTGAVIHDITNVLNRRFPGVEVIFCPVLVQGIGAPPQIIDAIQRFERLGCADLLIVGRGGGSMEDLWAFNDEKLVRAVANCSVPIISAVGHETDFTLCDFAADLRAPTPSAAAELAVPERFELAMQIASAENALLRGMRNHVVQGRMALHQWISALNAFSPRRMLEEKAQDLDRWTGQMEQSFRRNLMEKEAAWKEACGKLHSLSPLAVLSRGYVVASQEDSVVTRASQIDPEKELKLRFSDGEVTAKVQKSAQK